MSARKSPTSEEGQGRDNPAFSDLQEVELGENLGLDGDQVKRDQQSDESTKAAGGQEGIVRESLSETEPVQHDEGKPTIEVRLKSKYSWSSVKKWFTGTNFFVYCSHFLSAWGDRMWSFGVGLFLIEIAPESLQLTAIYGLSSGGAILFLGAIIGDWVDRTPRLKAAQIALVLQNVLVVLSAGCVYAYLHFRQELEIQGNGWLQPVGRTVIILLTILGNLASLARVIAVERDWIVEICGGDRDMLAKMTSTLRRIDLATNILAPIVSGQIMSFAHIENGALFMGGWNLLSVFLEYYLIWKVYSTVPALKKIKFKRRGSKPAAAAVASSAEVNQDEITEPPEEHTNLSSTSAIELKNIALASSDPSEENSVTDEKSTEKANNGRNLKEEEDASEDIVTSDGEQTVGSQSAVDVKIKAEKSAEEKPPRCACCWRLLSSFVTLKRGWKTYMNYDVANAGLGLACLYMTVLGFDNITVGYAYMQGVSEFVLGLLMAAGAVAGIIGTLVYPYIRRSLGLERTGLIALACQIACLTPCVLSVWMPGSPFDLHYASRPQINTTDMNCSVMEQTVLDSFVVNVSRTTPPQSAPPLPMPTPMEVFKEGYSTIGDVIGGDNVTSSDCKTVPPTSSSLISISLLLAGIVTARFGLWLADLTITQLFLERVVEEERGIVNGVQSSLNKLMDMLKFVMVVAAPQPQIFGLLIIISFAFICLGLAFYASYSRRARGHLLPFHACGGKKYDLPSAA